MMDLSVIQSLFDKGGILMWPLAVLLVWGLLLIAVKGLQLRRGRIVNPKLVGSLEEMLLNNRMPDATAFCKKHSAPVTRIALAGILNFDRPENELKEIVEEAGRQEVPGIRRHLTSLGIIAAVSPLLGLLGTVLGMVEVFATLGQGQGIQATDLASGISEALVTTAAGLTIAIPMVTFHNLYSNKANNLIIALEKTSLHMVQVLQRSA